MAVPQVKRTLTVTPTEKDHQTLQLCFDRINSERFGGELKIQARWGYPSAVENTSDIDELEQLAPADYAIVQRGLKAYSARQFEHAKELLEPYIGFELRHIKRVYISILRHLKEPVWFDLAQTIWKSGADNIAAPCASIEMRDNEETILVSPALASIVYKAPEHVLRYILFHEGLHKVLNTQPFNPHPPIFRRLELKAQRRSEAIEWLRKHKFATLED